MSARILNIPLQQFDLVFALAKLTLQFTDLSFKIRGQMGLRLPFAKNILRLFQNASSLLVLTLN